MARRANAQGEGGHGHARLSVRVRGPDTTADAPQGGDQLARALHGLGHSQHRFEVASRWFNGKAEILSYALDELLGTKLRALYQRKKGRDLFDLGLALTQAKADPARIIEAFTHYMKAEGANVTRAIFEENLAGKLKDTRFAADMGPLLAPGRTWKLEEAAARIAKEIVVLLPGDPWKGKAKK